MTRQNSSTRRRLPLSAALCASILAAPAAMAEGSHPSRSAVPPSGMTIVGPGTYRPLYPASPAEREVPVPGFFMDVRPVSNADFLAFVRARPEWRRDHVKPLFADGEYLSHWKGAAEIGGGAGPRQPVVRVSWFAAKAYCAVRGARLPTEREWELAAAASDTKADGSNDPAWRDRILAWYSEPASRRELPNTGKTSPNFWGIRDLHGVVWEWVFDYGASLVTADSREKGEGDGARFCGGAAASARDASDYAAFMRVAFRSSLEARYTSPRLGFRCAKDIASDQSP